MREREGMVFEFVCVNICLVKVEMNLCLNHSLRNHMGLIVFVLVFCMDGVGVCLLRRKRLKG